MKKILLHIITLGGAFVLTNSFASAQYGTIKGKIMGNDSALAAASITAGNVSVRTDDHGEFSLLLSPGRYKLTISYTGYQKIIQEIKITGNEMQSFEFTMIPVEQLGEIVVIGSRSAVKRSNLHTPVPIDVLSSTQLRQTGQTSISQMLNYTAPSVNAARQTLNEPITLRGLYPDQLLILVNGVRQHNMAWFHQGIIGGVLGKGSVSNDINSIPFSAIDKVEILRDGASAQYGSDAIAGVINILLKGSIQRTSIDFHSGQFYQGDGQNVQIEFNSGVSLNKDAGLLPGSKKSFLNFSADVDLRDPTYRGGVYTGTVYTNNKAIDDSVVKVRNFDRNKVSNAGNASLARIGALVNGAYQTNKNLEIFWTGLFDHRTTVFKGAYRFPKNTRLVNTDLFPDGFKGKLKEVVKTFTGTAGIRGTMAKGMRWDYTTSFGSNTETYYGENTNNASQYLLGKNAPTSFYTGTLIFQQLINALNFNKGFSGKRLKTKFLNLGFGAEWRIENFQMKAGEEAAWKNYDPTGKKDGAAQSGLVVSPENVVNKIRHIAGTYIDLETEVNRTLIDLASRYEYYSDFGSNLAGKLALRYKLRDGLTLRCSINNGYRAPSMQQRYYGAISKGITFPGFTIVRRGIFNNDHEVVRLFGVPPLEAERSLNLSGGFTSSVCHHIYITIDAYWIQIKNRIILSGDFDRNTNHEVDSLLVNYPDIEQVAFFTNAINTRTHGLDAAINSNWSIHKKHLAVMLNANLTRTKLFGKIEAAANLSSNEQTNTLFNRQEITRVEKGQPASKVILSCHYDAGKFGFQLRNTRFGKTKFVFNPDSTNYDEFFSSKILTDFTISYTFKKGMMISLGANNIFNVYPDPIKNPVNTADGRNIYGTEAQPFGFNGGYYFVSLALSL